MAIIRSRFRRPVPIPGAGTRKTTAGGYEFVKGWNSNISNDNLPENQWRHVQDARQPELGRWVTRKGNEPFSVPIGETVNAEQTSTTGAGDQDVSTSTWVAKKITASADGLVTRIEANVRNNNTGSGALVLALYEDDGGEPGDLLFRTTIDESDIGPSYSYEAGYSISCPEVSNTADYWVVLYIQEGGGGTYEVSTTTAASTALVSTDSGSTWQAAGFDVNVKVYTADAGGVKGLGHFQRPDGSIVTVMAHGEDLYTIDNSTGATSSVDSGLDADSTEVRVAFINDTLYYTDGKQKPRKYDFNSATEVSAAPEAARDVLEHKGLAFYVSADDPTKMYFSNFAAYDTFTSTDYIYVPAPKTADPIQRLISFNGVLYIYTRRSKYALLGSSNQDFRLEPAIGQKGLIARNGLTYDENYIYFASDDGIYRYNGAEERNIATDILDIWTELENKENTVLEAFNNRVYVWYTPNGENHNTRCLVFNTVYNHWESHDTLGQISTAWGTKSFDGKFLQASNRVGMVMLAEPDSNNYRSLGEPLSYELFTGYNHAKVPAQYKRAPYFRPHFNSPEGAYKVAVGYDFDYHDAPTYQDVFLTQTHVTPLDELRIDGQFRRVQVRYRHEAAGQPVGFDGHAMTFEAERII